MKNGTKADGSYLLGVQKKMDSQVSDMQKQFEGMQNGFLDGVHSFWDGEAHDAFTKDFGVFLSDVTAHLKEWAALTVSLQQCGKNYNTADSDVKRLVQKMP